MPKSVAWREGLFIRPQHFPQSNYLHHNEMMQRSVVSQANIWGLFDFQIDNQLLSQGKIALISASGILPDGTIFDHKDFIQNLIVSINKEDAGQAIYLALPLQDENANDTYFEEQEALPTRYVAKTHNDVPNTNAGEESQADLIFAYPNFKLLKENEMVKGYSRIKIAQVGNVTANNHVSIEESFHPTYLHLHKATSIISKLNELQGMVHFRTEKLAEKTMGGSLQATELRDYLILQILNKTESRLHYFLTQDNLHPGDLYLDMVSLIGELSVFMKAEKRQLEQFTYIHEKQNISFNEVFLELKTLLNHVLEDKSIRLPIDKHKFGVSIAMLKDKSLLQNSSFVLAVSSNIDTEKLKKLLLDNLKIGSANEISKLVNHHLPGFKLVPLTTAPREIPYRVNQNYYRISLDNKEREKLANSTGIAFHYPETNNLTIEFILWAIKTT